MNKTWSAGAGKLRHMDGDAGQAAQDAAARTGHWLPALLRWQAALLAWLAAANRRWLRGAPLASNFTVFTVGSAILKLSQAVDAQFRYERQKSILFLRPPLFVNEYDVRVTYRLGKFTFDFGLLNNRENNVGSWVRHRDYLYFPNALEAYAVA